MPSAFGVEHEILKYSREYGSANEVPDNTTRRKLRPLPDTEKITIRKGPRKKRKTELQVAREIAKSYAKLAPKLAAAAAKGDKYAALRMAAGNQGPKVAEHMAVSRSANKNVVPLLNRRGRQAKLNQAKVSHLKAIGAAQTGRTAAQGAKKIASDASATNYAREGTGIGTMEEHAQRMMGTTPRKPDYERKSGKVKMLTAGAVGVGGGGGAYLYSQRKKSA
jgi:hypothetical protein